MGKRINNDKLDGFIDPNRYTKAPMDALCDDRLTNSTKCVLFYMGGRCFGGPNIHITQKEIGNALSMHRRTVVAAIQSLEDCGHIEVARNRGRGYYRMTSPVYIYRASNG